MVYMINGCEYGGPRMGSVSTQGAGLDGIWSLGCVRITYSMFWIPENGKL
jgi:hypothetical protein